MSKLQRPQEEIEVNLIPIMNLFTALIPFLLMSAAFFEMSMIKVSVPVASSSGETDIAKEEDKVTLNLRITNKSYDLSASSDTVSPALLKQLKASVPRAKGSDKAQEAALAKVSAAAYRIKGRYKASDTAIVVPDEDIPFEQVVNALDAVRDHWVPRGSSREKVVLFPRAVLSSLVK